MSYCRNRNTDSDGTLEISTVCFKNNFTTKLPKIEYLTTIIKTFVT